MAISPTAEGFRAAFRYPSLAVGEIVWRWSIGATASVLFFFGLFEYLRTLPVTNGELLFLRTRQPYLVAEAIMHILRGSLDRAVMSALLAALLLALLWIVTASFGRMATTGAMLDCVREQLAPKNQQATGTTEEPTSRANSGGAFQPLVRLNFLRFALAVAAITALAGAVIIAGFVSPADNPEPGLAFLLFVPIAAVICLAWSSLNWLLSLAGMFAVRDRDDAMGAISAAVAFCRDHLGAVFAVSSWTGVAHLVVLVGATTLVSMPLGFAGAVPWRLIAAAVILVTLGYFAVADWLYTARFAGYVCIAEMPDALLAPPPPAMPPPPPMRDTIDREELILSDVPGLVRG